ncbi:Pet127-domain-containing protein [Epithele typhae]|uniref:Pet127-domain-containing protein n=1 Tax=Epithele typhae TaxID=378194 RepID=UPI002008BCDC|nr:Pet127-domain-containing protein [Epithele typhae]KAH9922820.1 Pet127-domain-containing protein [Epithele typhae]
MNGQPSSDARAYNPRHVPTLAHGLDAVLNRCGVHWLQDPDTGEFNFPKYLATIPQPDQFAFDRVGRFMPPSKDPNMPRIMRDSFSMFGGSTSSLTGILGQIYFLLSDFKPTSNDMLGSEFKDAPRAFSRGQRVASSVCLHYSKGTYLTDIDESHLPSEEVPMILLSLGILLEKFLTLPQEEFAQLLKSNEGGSYTQHEDVHRYAKAFLMRSQLDCVHENLPGSGVFDLKTRANYHVRHDVYNYLQHTNSTLRSLKGPTDSFEKEFHDMIRNSFLDYSFQARIGNMDGVFVAFHNTARIFGFQYISLDEMDECLYGVSGTGQRVFQRCVYIMERLYRTITKSFPKKSLYCTFETRGNVAKGTPPVLRVWVEPKDYYGPGRSRPVKEFTLSLVNYVDGARVSGDEAVMSKSPWDVRYVIELREKDQKAIRRRRAKAYAAQRGLGSFGPARTPTQDEPAEEEETDDDLPDVSSTEVTSVIEGHVDDTMIASQPNAPPVDVTS